MIHRVFDAPSPLAGAAFSAVNGGSRDADHFFLRVEAVCCPVVDVERAQSIPPCGDDIRLAGLVDIVVRVDADGSGERANEVMIGGGNTGGGQRGVERDRQRVNVVQGNPLSVD